MLYTDTYCKVLPIDLIIISLSMVLPLADICIVALSVSAQIILMRGCGLADIKISERLN